MMRTVVAVFLACLSTVAGAQPKVQPESVDIRRVMVTIRLDGVVDEATWKEAEVRS
jgi:hypothetical protein